MHVPANQWDELPIFAELVQFPRDGETRRGGTEIEWVVSRTDTDVHRRDEGLWDRVRLRIGRFSEPPELSVRERDFRVVGLGSALGGSACPEAVAR
ncbi:MAG: hypothetical protein ACI8T1_003447 [Verrucomicrobiales bacterium]|jgi:hypothetical protein